MSSPHQGLWSTLAMFIPLLAVPFLAAIGIPQFTPTAASSEDEPPELSELQDVEIGVGESLHGADDLFAPLSERGSLENSAENGSRSESSTGRWDDPFQNWGDQAPRDRDAGASATRENPPSVRSSAAERSWDEQRHGSANTGRQLERPGVGGTRGDSRGALHEWLSLEEESPFGMSGMSREREARPSPEAGMADRSSRRDDVSLAASDAAESPFSNGAADRGVERRTSDEKPLTWPEARRRLSELGIGDFQLNPGEAEGHFHFACTFTPPESPRIVHRFEAEAAEPLAAVEKVIRQIEAWRGRP